MSHNRKKNKKQNQYGITLPNDENASNPLAGKFSPPPKLTDAERSRLEAERDARAANANSQASYEADHFQFLDKAVRIHEIEKDLVKAESALAYLEENYKDAKSNYESAKADVSASRLADRKKEIKNTSLALSGQILQKKDSLMKLLESYSGKHKTEVAALFNHLKNATVNTGKGGTGLDPEIITLIKSLASQIQSTIHATRNILQRSKEMKLSKFFDSLPLKNVTDMNKLVVDVKLISQQNHALSNLEGRMLELGGKVTAATTLVQEKKNELRALKASLAKAPSVTSTSSTFFARPQQKKPQTEPSNDVRNDRRSTRAATNPSKTGR